ncbi:MAG: dienelactone hydrolase family protein [Geitlerinemataceae cyanobacterium]
MKVISISPKNNQDPKGLIALLHGWGANADDLASLTPLLHLPDYQFLCPEAPLIHPHVPQGKMWYDLETSEHKGLPESQRLLTNWLKGLESQTNVPLSKTILAGFSQGGAMTLDVGLSLENAPPLAGLVVFSGYLHATIDRKTTIRPPVLMLHGTQDPIVPVTAARQARDTLTQLGIATNYREFDIAHEICPEEITLMREFTLQAIARS